MERLMDLYFKKNGEIIGDEEYNNSCKIYVASNSEVT